MPLFRYKDRVALFVHIPKTGGSSIETGLRELGVKRALHYHRSVGYSKCNPQHAHAEIYAKWISSDFYDFAFAVCRNPYARIASEYRMRVTNKGGATPFAPWLQEAADRFSQNRYTLDNHLRPQTEFLLPGLTLFRFEDGLGAAFQVICGRLGIAEPKPIPHVRKGAVGDIEADLASIALIKDLYHVDFERFGYDPDSYREAFSIAG